MEKNLRIVCIGAGNLATNLAYALQQQGFQIEQVYSRTQQSAQELAQGLGASYTCSLDELLLGRELYLVSLRDDALLELAPQIMADKEDALVVHTAGSVAMDVLAAYGNRVGVLYPMQTFSKARLVSFSSIPVFLEAAQTRDLALLRSIASKLTSRVFEADSEQRKKLHLAAVFASNFANHMYTLSAEFLTKYGLPFESMLSLIDETTSKVHTVSPAAAQTGPASRNDQDVMAEHIAMLADMPQLQEIYKLVSASILNHKTDNK